MADIASPESGDLDLGEGSFELKPSPFADDPEYASEEDDETPPEDDEGEIPEEEGEEGDPEAELSEEELDAILATLESEAEEEEEKPEASATVPHAALHKERERRKELQAQHQTLLQQSNQLMEVNKGYQDQLADIQRQLKELGIDEMVKINIEAPSQEVIDARMQAQQKADQEQLTGAIQSLRQEAMAHVDEFPAIDPKDEEQGELILGYALASVFLGADPEDAILKGMGIINKRLLSERKAANRKVVKTPGKTTSPKRAPRASSVASAVKTGNVKSLFTGIAGDMLQNRE